MHSSMSKKNNINKKITLNSYKLKELFSHDQFMLEGD